MKPNEKAPSHLRQGYELEKELRSRGRFTNKGPARGRPAGDGVVQTSAVLFRTSVQCTVGGVGAMEVRNQISFGPIDLRDEFALLIGRAALEEWSELPPRNAAAASRWFAGAFCLSFDNLQQKGRSVGVLAATSCRVLISYEAAYAVFLFLMDGGVWMLMKPRARSALEAQRA